MRVIYGLDNVPDESTDRAVAIGVFDGVHWGHKSIFSHLLQEANNFGLQSLTFTFEKNPAELLAPTRAPYYISTLSQRIELIQSTGVDSVVIADFTPHLAHISREDFLSQVLIDKLRTKRLVVGANFRFGRNREGDIRYLSEVAPDLGIGITVVPAVVIDGGPVSSTRIRAHLLRGDVEIAAKLLGHRFALRGTVVMGNQIGRSIGFPTANVKGEPRQLIPGRGVYAVETTIDKTPYMGVCNIGTRPTFDGEGITVEVHIDGFQGDIYGRQLDVVFCRRLRDELKFSSRDSLVSQIREDLQRANKSCRW
ncbi:MAG: bifunctional riboflavin kinase/FAD synthetase [Armatimonadetes bacterium]|nr:bifunctional riboflavin kinase/FAD synthetase [Armatimonadota bacterium]